MDPVINLLSPELLLMIPIVELEIILLDLQTEQLPNFFQVIFLSPMLPLPGFPRVFGSIPMALLLHIELFNFTTLPRTKLMYILILVILLFN